jgi:hypothetical protein
VSLRIYIAYGTAADQVNALRLQALGAVNGLTVFVPPAFTRQDFSGELDPQSEQRLQESEIILGVLTVALSEACRRELNLGKQLGKKTVLISEPALASQLAPYFPGSVLVVDPANPANAEREIVQFLRDADLKEDAAKALLALGTIALGLSLFAPQD